VTGRIIREGYKTLTFRGGRLHLKSWDILAVPNEEWNVANRRVSDCHRHKRITQFSKITQRNIFRSQDRINA